MRNLFFLIAFLIAGSYYGMAPAHAQSNMGCVDGVIKWSPINIASGTTTSIATGALGKNVYVCKLFLQTNAANNVGLIEGTGTSGTCSAAIVGMAGGATAATGFNMPANGTVNLNGGDTAYAVTAVQADNVCLITSATTQLSGVVAYVIQ